jgi:hypothetical protein
VLFIDSVVSTRSAILYGDGVAIAAVEVAETLSLGTRKILPKNVGTCAFCVTMTVLKFPDVEPVEVTHGIPRLVTFATHAKDVAIVAFCKFELAFFCPVKAL